MLSLLSLKNYLAKCRSCSLSDLVNNFKEEPSYILHMLENLECRGLVRCYKKESNCGSSCQACPSAYFIKVEFLAVR